jgi:hypothetical protein
MAMMPSTKRGLEVIMRVAVKKSLALAAVFLGVCVGSARAEEVTVKVPFPFVVRGQTLPAGEYVVTPATDDSTVMIIRGGNPRHESMALIETIPADGHDQAGDTPSLTFTHVENEYRLATIWESWSAGRTLLKQ